MPSIILGTEAEREFGSQKFNVSQTLMSWSCLMSLQTASPIQFTLGGIKFPAYLVSSQLYWFCLPTVHHRKGQVLEEGEAPDFPFSPSFAFPQIFVQFLGRILGNELV